MTFPKENPPLPRRKYPCVVVDPPWSFADKGTRLAPSYEGGQRTYSHYRTMSLTDICLFPIEKVLTPDAWVFLWIPNSLRRDRTEHLVARSWGLILTGSEMVWVKIAKDGRPRIGGGHYFRSAHETCLLLRRGKPTRASASVPSVFLAERGRHSEKPDEFFDLVEAFCLGPRLDLFARKPRSGWSGWGSEYPRDESET